MIHRSANIWFLAILLVVACSAVACSAAAQVRRIDADLPSPPPQHFYDAMGLVSQGQARSFAGDLYGFEQIVFFAFLVLTVSDVSEGTQ